MISKLKPIIWKETLELRRDKLSLYTYIFLPSFLLFLYGYAISLDVKHIKTAICDLDNSNQSRELARKLFSSEYFDSAGYAADERELDMMMRTGKATAGMLVYPDFSRGIKTGGKAPLLLLLDGSNAQIAQSAIGYLYGITADLQMSMLADVSLKTGLSLPLVDVRERIWYNQRLESSKNLITGLIAFVLMIVATIATTLAIVREKENGSIEQMVVTPVSALTILVGKIVPYFILSIVASVLMIVFAVSVFNVPFAGSFLLFSAALLLFLLGALGLGLFISTISQTQQFAFTAATFITLLPTNILSGFIFPIESMPKAVQYFTYIVPARYFIEISRSIFLKGSEFGALWHDYLALGIFAVLFLAAATLRIRVKGLM